MLSLSDSHQCGPGEFTCARGVCIREAWRCDGDNDCRDWSDEANCTVGHHTCEANSFQCHTGHCIPQRWMCDGDDDCQDGSDEDPRYCGTLTRAPVKLGGEGELMKFPSWDFRGTSV